MKKYLLLFPLLTGVFFISCSEDDDRRDEPFVKSGGFLQVRSQIYDDGTVTVDNILLSNDGWVAIYRFNSKREELLGFTYVEAGEHNDVLVELDNSSDVKSGETLVAMLHGDLNTNGVFDWDGEKGIDLPLKTNGREISRIFSVMIPGESWITVEDQPVFNNSIKVANLSLDKVNKEWIESETVWLVAHEETNSFGNIGDIIGISEALTIGSHDNVTVTFDKPVKVGETILLLLYNNSGNEENFEVGIDKPVWDEIINDILMTSFIISNE